MTSFNDTPDFEFMTGLFIAHDIDFALDLKHSGYRIIGTSFDSKWILTLPRQFKELAFRKPSECIRKTDCDFHLLGQKLYSLCLMYTLYGG